MLRRFGAYSFIVINWVFCVLAALQPPVIMMNQRLQETKNRLCAPNPCRVLLMAELESHQFHPKIDHQLAQHGNKLAEMQ